jgi:FKBP-type peptidyl-prolyl cis-trans isomerase
MSKVTAVPLRPVSRAGLVALWLGIILFIAAGLGAAWYLARPAVMTAMPASDFLLANGNRAGIKTTPSGLEYEVIEPGAGATPTPADVARIEYRGTLPNGTEFDATKGQPVNLPVGQMIPGFAEALTLMPRGSRYRIWIPPELAYGDRPPPGSPIQAGAVLVFDLTMHDFAPMPPQQMPQGMPGM